MKLVKMGIFLAKRKSTRLSRDLKLLTQAIRQCGDMPREAGGHEI